MDGALEKIRRNQVLSLPTKRVKVISTGIFTDMRSGEYRGISEVLGRKFTSVATGSYLRDLRRTCRTTLSANTTTGLADSTAFEQTIFRHATFLYSEQRRPFCTLLTE